MRSLLSPESSHLGCHGSLSRVLTSPVWSTGWFWLLGAGIRTVSPGLSLASSHSGVLCDASWSPHLFPRSLRRSLASCLAAWPLPHYRWSRNHGQSSAGFSCWVSALLSAVSWWYRTSWLAQGCVPLLRPFALLLALWSSVPSGSLLLYIAPSLRDEVTLPGRVCLDRNDGSSFTFLVFGHKPSGWGHPYRVVLRISAHSIGSKASSSTCP